MGYFLGALRPAASFALATTTSSRHGGGGCAFHRSSPRVASLLRSGRPTLSTTTSALLGAASSERLAYSTHAVFNDEIIDQYDAFILDQFGVLHNGIHALEGAVELVNYLYQTKKKRLIILSNTSAPADKALAKLPKFGFSAGHFQDAVTSGEESSRYILETYGGGNGNTNNSHDNNNYDDQATTPTTTKALMFTWDASMPDNPRLTAPPEVYLERCGTLEVATSIEEADLLLLHGSEVWYRGKDVDAVPLAPFIEEGDFSSVDPILKACVARNLPAVCANPDFVVQTPSGDGVAYMPGKIAARYETLGGSCETFGKPAVEHFEACIRTLGLDKSRVAHVGDSLHHDIAGAVRAGIPSVFVTSGIHKNDFGTNFGELPAPDVLEALMEKEGGDIRPTHVVPAFRL